MDWETLLPGKIANNSKTKQFSLFASWNSIWFGYPKVIKIEKSNCSTANTRGSSSVNHLFMNKSVCLKLYLLLTLLGKTHAIYELQNTHCLCESMACCHNLLCSSWNNRFFTKMATCLHLDYTVGILTRRQSLKKRIHRDKMTKNLNEKKRPWWTLLVWLAP